MSVRKSTWKTQVKKKNKKNNNLTKFKLIIQQLQAMLFECLTRVLVRQWIERKDFDKWLFSNEQRVMYIHFVLIVNVMLVVLLVVVIVVGRANALTSNKIAQFIDANKQKKKARRSKWPLQIPRIPNVSKLIFELLFFYPTSNNDTYKWRSEHKKRKIFSSSAALVTNYKRFGFFKMRTQWPSFDTLEQ